MKALRLRIVQLGVLCAIQSAAAQNAAPPPPPDGRWRVELSGPTVGCRIPARIAFSVADAIVGGKVSVDGRVYWPRGRMKDDGSTELTLIRTAADRRPLVHVEGAARGLGRWRSAGPGCEGAARIAPR